MQKELGFGAGVQRLKTPEKSLLGVLTPNPVEKDLTGEAEVRRALQNPIGTASLKEIEKPGKKIATTTDITLVFALGSHSKHTPEKQKNWQASMPSTKLPASTAMQMTACTSL